MRHAALLALVLPVALSAQAPPERRAVAWLGTSGDTLRVERWVRLGDRVALEWREPDGTRWRSDLDTDPEGGIERLTLRRWSAARPDSAPAEGRFEVVVGRGVGVTRDGTSGAPLSRLAVAAGAVPLDARALVLLQRQVDRADVEGDIWYNGAWLTPVLASDGPVARSDTLRLRTLGVDSLELRVGTTHLVLAIDEANRIVGGRGTEGGTPFRIVELPRSVADAPWPIERAAYPAPEHAAAEEVAIRADDGATLAGTLVRPTGVARPPVVLLLSGSGAQERDGATMAGYRPFRELAAALAAAGIASLRLDDRGVGGSGGDYAARAIPGLVADARAAIHWLGRRADLADGAIVAGHSEGALVALESATDAAVRGVVLLAAPARPGREIVAAQQRYGATRLVGDSAPARRDRLADSLVRAAAPAVARLAAASPAFRFLLGYDPAKAAGRVRRPVLLLHGETDRQVPVDQVEELAALLRRKAPSVRVVRFPATDHLFLADPDGDPARYLLLEDRRVRPEVLAAVVAWVADLTRDGPP